MKTTQSGNQKVCSKCNVIKHIDEFPKAHPTSASFKRYHNGIKPWCKNCYRDYNAQYMKNARTKKPMYSHYYKKYGLTNEEVMVMHEEREFKCDICGNKTDHRYDKLCVDHDHSTGNVRGLLCFSCNIVLGNAKDDIQILKNAISYLEKNK